MKRVVPILLSLAVASGCVQEAPMAPEDALQSQTGVEPGLPPNNADVTAFNSEVTPSGPAGILPIVTETGHISLSVDAMGTLAPAGVIHVEKPAGATVRGAYLLSARVPGSGQMPAGAVTIIGQPVTWSGSASNSLRSVAAYSYWADVTGIIKPLLDAAPPGITGIPVGESGSAGIDGEILAVIFDDPNQTTDNTVSLLFGAQKTAGDQFYVALANPLDLSEAGLTANLSLGISFGYQGGGQYSTVDVNGARMTTAAGGQDDGAGANGALITVGGIGDTNGNPANPYATPSHTRSDDELYNLLPFLADGDQLITVNTRNPSNDDNIFFSAFFLTVPAVIVTNPDELPTNTAPTADAGNDQVLECVGSCNNVQLDGSASSDPEGDALSYTWTDADGNVLGTGETITACLGIGTHTITLTVTDGEFESTDDVVVTVEDTVGPTINAVQLATELWAPNHQMHLVATGISATDDCDDDVDLNITVTSNEPANDIGDGNTEADWEIVDNGDGTYGVYVRAERSGTGDGRIYTITITADDGYNTATTTMTVTVPHSRGKKK